MILECKKSIDRHKIAGEKSTNKKSDMFGWAQKRQLSNGSLIQRTPIQLSLYFPPLFGRVVWFLYFGVDRAPFLPTSCVR